jgi:O-antigen ligase
MTVLARMGVPGFVMWLLLQGAWIIGVVRASNSLRRNGEVALALLAACVAVYWMAMMINTSFDPYLEGPQGGIWFWTIFGLGMGMMKFARGTPPA